MSNPNDPVEPDASMRGVSADFAQRVALLLQRPLEWRTFPNRVAMIDALRAHRIDAATSATGTDAGPPLRYSRAYVDSRQVFVERRVMGARTRRIAYVEGQTSPQHLRDAYPALDPVGYPDTLSALLAVSLRDTDAFVGDLLTAGYTIDHEDLSSLTISGFATFDEAGYSFAFPPDPAGDALRLRVDAALAALPPRFLPAVQARWAATTAVTFAQPLVLSNAERAWIAAHPVVTYSTYSDAAPVSFRDSNGQPAGLAIDTLATIGNMTGLRFEGLLRDSTQRTIEDLHDGRASMIAYGLLEHRSTPERVATKPIGEGVMVIVTRAGAGGLRDAKALAGKRVAVWGNPSLIAMLRERVPSVNIVETSPVGGQFDAVVNRDADATVVDLTIANYAVGNSYLGKLVITGAFSTQPVQRGFLVARDEPVLLAILNHAIEHIHPAEFDAIRRRWLLVEHPENQWQRRRPQVVVGALIGLALLVLLVAWALSLRMQITRRRAAQRAMRVAKDEAEQANRAKSAFLAAISHEIRTPMNAVLGLLELELRNPGDRASTERTLGTAHQAARDLLGMIDDLLDVAKIEAGRLSLVVAPFEWRAWIEGVVAIYEPAARAKGVLLTIHVLGANEGAWLEGDALRLRQVLGNLLSNAIKFTDAGEVSVEYSIGEPIGLPIDASRQLVLSVSDTGMGIPVDQQALLFTPFAQAQQKQSQRFGGTGLGLTICRRLLTLMGGSITLASTPGQGSRFTVHLRLPICEPGSGLGVTTLAPSKPALILQGLRVLVVDDHPASRMLLKSQLDTLGCSVETANDGQAAFALWRDRLGAESAFEMILTDCSMPVMSGEDLARAIRGVERSLAGSGRRTGPAPIVGMTANAQPECAKEAVDAGMTLCLVKPLGLDALRDGLMHALARLTHDADEALPAASAGVHRPAFGSLLDAPSKSAAQAAAQGPDVQDAPVYGPEHNVVSSFNSRHASVDMRDDEHKDAQDFMTHVRAARTYAPFLTAFVSDSKPASTLSVRVDSSVPQSPKPPFDERKLNAFGEQATALAQAVQYANQHDLEDARRAFSLGNFDHLRELAHRMKGAAFMIGAMPFADACRDLQQACETQVGDDCARDTASIHRAYQRFHDEALALAAALAEHLS